MSSKLKFEKKRQAYPDLTLTEVQFAYDVSEVMKLDKQRRAMHIGKMTSERIYEQTNRRPQMHPFHFGSLVELCCCCCSAYLLKKKAGGENNPNSPTDSINFYSKNEQDLTLQINGLKQDVLKHPLGIVFVTFETQKMADSFLKHYRYLWQQFRIPLSLCFYLNKLKIGANGTPTQYHLCSPSVMLFMSRFGPKFGTEYGFEKRPLVCQVCALAE